MKAIDTIIQPRSFEHVAAAQRALDDFVRSITKRFSISGDPRITLSEQYIFNLLRAQLDSAILSHHEYLRLTRHPS